MEYDKELATTHGENRDKNKLMVAELLMLGYGVIKMKGVYPEEMSDESSEESYLVINRNNDENFLNNLLRISEYYNQDLIYNKEKGKAKGDLIGTNDCGLLVYHQKGEVSELKTDTASNYMSRLDDVFWRNLIDGKMLIKEDIHPLTRKIMGEELRKMRKIRGTTDK